jgi:hypothetical protein
MYQPQFARLQTFRGRRQPRAYASPTTTAVSFMSDGEKAAEIISDEPRPRDGAHFASSGNLEMSSLSESRIGIALAGTSNCRQSETIVASSWQRVARRANRNFCAIMNDVTGRRLLFKHNLGVNFRYMVTDAERRRRDIANILASLSETFALHSVVYRDTLLIFSDGHQLRGVACDHLDHRRRLQVVPQEHITN